MFFLPFRTYATFDLIWSLPCAGSFLARCANIWIPKPPSRSLLILCRHGRRTIWVLRRRVVRGCFRALRHACLAHPGAIPLIESADVLPAAVFRPMEITLDALHGAGFSSDDALRAHALLTTFTLGQVSYQIKGWGRGVDAQSAVSDSRITPTAFPAVVRAVSFRNWDFDKSFEFGLSTILSGLSARTRKRIR